MIVYILVGVDSDHLDISSSVSQKTVPAYKTRDDANVILERMQAQGKNYKICSTSIAQLNAICLVDGFTVRIVEPKDLMVKHANS